MELITWLERNPRYAFLAGTASLVSLFLQLATETTSTFWSTLLVIVSISVLAAAAFVIVRSYRRARGVPLASERPSGTRSAVRGLISFEPEDEEVFERLGRLQDVAHWHQAVLHSEFRAGVVIGRSGAGKTSALRAGLSPLLAKAGYVVVYVRVDETEPAASLEGALAELYPSASDAPLEQLLAEASADSKKPIFVIFDQFEQFFLRRRRRDLRERFPIDLVSWLSSTSPTRLRVLFAIRDDMLGQFSEIQESIKLALGPSNLFRLDFFSVEQAGSVLRSLASADGIPMPPDLADEIASELGSRNDGDVSPVDLQIIGWQLSKSSKVASAELNKSTLVAAGGVTGLLEKFLSLVIASNPDSKARDAIPSILVALTDGDIENSAGPRTARDVWRRAETRLSQRQTEAILQWLSRSDVRLTRVTASGPGARYELAHEGLLEPLRNLSGVGQSMHRQAERLLEQRTKEWLANRRGRRYLLRSSEFLKVRRYASETSRRASQELLRTSARRLAQMCVAVALVTVALLGWATYLRSDHFAERSAVARITDLSGNADDRAFELILLALAPRQSAVDRALDLRFRDDAQRRNQAITSLAQRIAETPSRRGQDPGLSLVHQTFVAGLSTGVEDGPHPAGTQQEGRHPGSRWDADATVASVYAGSKDRLVESRIPLATLDIANVLRKLIGLGKEDFVLTLMPALAESFALQGNPAAAQTILAQAEMVLRAKPSPTNDWEASFHTILGCLVDLGHLRVSAESDLSRCKWSDALPQMDVGQVQGIVSALSGRSLPSHVASRLGDNWGGEGAVYRPGHLEQLLGQLELNLPEHVGTFAKGAADRLTPWPYQELLRSRYCAPHDDCLQRLSSLVSALPTFAPPLLVRSVIQNLWIASARIPRAQRALLMADTLSRLPPSKERTELAIGIGAWVSRSPDGASELAIADLATLPQDEQERQWFRSAIASDCEEIGCLEWLRTVLRDTEDVGARVGIEVAHAWATQEKAPAPYDRSLEADVARMAPGLRRGVASIGMGWVHFRRGNLSLAEQWLQEARPEWAGRGVLGHNGLRHRTEERQYLVAIGRLAGALDNAGVGLAASELAIDPETKIAVLFGTLVQPSYPGPLHAERTSHGSPLSYWADLQLPWLARTALEPRKGPRRTAWNTLRRYRPPRERELVGIQRLRAVHESERRRRTLDEASAKAGVAYDWDPWAQLLDRDAGAYDLDESDFYWYQSLAEASVDKPAEPPDFSALCDRHVALFKDGAKPDGIAQVLDHLSLNLGEPTDLRGVADRFRPDDADCRRRSEADRRERDRVRRAERARERLRLLREEAARQPATEH